MASGEVGTEAEKWWSAVGSGQTVSTFRMVTEMTSVMLLLVGLTLLDPKPWKEKSVSLHPSAWASMRI